MRGTNGSAPTGVRRWYVLYVALACFELLTVLVSFGVGRQLIASYEGSLRATDESTRLLDGYARLARIAGEIDAPGNDVFRSREPAAERARMVAACARFERALRGMRGELRRAFPEDAALGPLGDLDLVARRGEEMGDVGRSLFAAYDAGDVGRASEEMARLDRLLLDLHGQIEAAQVQLREASRTAVLHEAESMSYRFWYETGLAGAILLIVVGLVAYGLAMHRRLVRDQAERELSLKALAASEARFRSLSTSSAVALLELDSDARCGFSNRRWQELSGLGESESRGLGWTVALDPDARERLLASWRDAGARGLELSSEYLLKNLRDGERWVLIHANPPAGGETPEVTRVLAIADITPRRRAEEALKASNAQLELWARKLERANQEISLLGEMGEMLQACATRAEVYAVATRFLPHVFPGTSGSLLVHDDVSRTLAVRAGWGCIEHGGPAFAAVECWAVRRGRVHGAEQPAASVPCPHLERADGTAHLCVPMNVQNEPLGVLHFRFPSRPEADAVTGAAERKLVETAAEQLALVLANLKLRERLQAESIRDPLTGLFNRRYLEETLARELERARREDGSLGLLLLDLDHFKALNDRHGHAAGDAVLRSLGDLLRARVRADDIACRYGGEEFLVILAGATAESIADRAEALRRAIEGLPGPAGDGASPEVAVTASVGAALYPRHGRSAEELLRAADLALYRAKALGRNRLVLAGSEMTSTPAA